jgi:hypothetical protein
MCFFINALNKKTIHLKYRQVNVTFIFLKMYQFEGCGCLALIRTLNCGVVMTRKRACHVGHPIDLDFFCFDGYKC